MKISINGSTNLVTADIDRVIEGGRQAADDGFAGYWLAQIGLVDALTVLAAIAPHAPDIALGTAVNATYPIHPTAMAAKALTTQALCGGRLTLGIGVNHAPVVEQVWGRPFEPAIRHILDYLGGLQALLDEGRADHVGESFTTRFEAARPTDEPPPIVLAALGPQMLKVAGSRTAGTILWMTGPKTIASHIAPTIRAAATDAGRPEPRVVCSLPICVADDETEVRAIADEVFAGYRELPSYRAMLDREGVDGAGNVMVCGDEDSVRSQLADIATAGATEFAAAPFGRSHEEFDRTRALLREIHARMIVRGRDPSTRWERDRASIVRALVLTAGAFVSAIVVGLVLVVISETADIDGATFTREPQVLGNLRWYAGFLSTLGVVIWVAGTGAVAALASTPQAADSRRLFLASAALAFAMAVDDIFLLHDFVYPVNESVVQVAYFAAIVTLIGLFRATIPTLALVASVGAVGLWMTSALMDRWLNDAAVNFDQLGEDTLKFAGIVVWTVGWVVAAVEMQRGTAAEDSVHAPPR